MQHGRTFNLLTLCNELPHVATPQIVFRTGTGKAAVFRPWVRAGTGTVLNSGTRVDTTRECGEGSVRCLHQLCNTINRMTLSRPKTSVIVPNPPADFMAVLNYSNFT
jgi:hypothetical protein